MVGWSLLLAVAGVVGGWGRRLRRYLFPLLVALAVCGVGGSRGIGPDHVAAWFPGSCWGWCIVVVRQLPATRHELVVTPRSDIAAVAAKIAMIVLCAAGLIAVRVHNAYGEQPQSEDPTSDADTVYQVVVPVDATFTPVGQYDYLPLEFYDALHLRKPAGHARTTRGCCGRPPIARCSIGGSSDRHST